jgi:hypothetical protein
MGVLDRGEDRECQVGENLGGGFKEKLEGLWA